MGELSKSYNYKEVIKFVLQVAFISAVAFFLENGELIVIFGAVMVIFGYWWKMRIFNAYEGSGFSIEYIYGLQYKIKSGYLEDLSSDERKEILGMKPAWWAKNHFVDNYESNFESDKMNKDEEGTLLSLKRAIKVRDGSIKIGLVLVIIGVVLFIVQPQVR